MAAGLPKSRWNGNGSNKTPNTTLGVALSYEGKRDEKEILTTEPSQVRVLWGPKAEAAPNRLYYGDNLPILASLIPEYAGKVRLIYIDPPYATKSVFQSRSQNDAYEDLLVGAHYIEYIRERLILLRELLSHDGSIYVHLDENMAFYVKMVMDEIFGPRNFRNWITRKKCNPKNYTRKTYGDVSDYIIFYTKSDEYVWNRAIEQWTDERARKEYTYVEEGTGRRYKKVPIHAPGVRNGETGKPWKGMMPPPGKHWQYTPATLDEMDARGEIFWSSNGNPRRKIYLDNTEGVPVQDIWLDFKDAHNQNIKITGYPTEKNPDLIKRIVEASSNPGDLILDCFSGSGTTLDVASELSRNWIGIDNSLKAIATTLKRFHKGTEAMGDFVSERNGKKAQTIPLSNRRESITNFLLYAAEESADNLRATLELWESWQ